MQHQAKKLLLPCSRTWQGNRKEAHQDIVVRNNVRQRSVAIGLVRQDDFILIIERCITLALIVEDI